MVSPVINERCLVLFGSEQKVDPLTDTDTDIYASTRMRYYFFGDSQQSNLNTWLKAQLCHYWNLASHLLFCPNNKYIQIMDTGKKV